MPPAIQQYEAFELLVASRTADGYPVTITHAPAGEATGLCRLDPAADDLQLALERIETGDTGDGFLAEFGRRLFDALLPDPIATLYRASLGMAREQGRGLRVRLRLEPPELAALPWEYLCDAEEDCFLGVSPETPLVRYVPLARPSRPIAVSPPLRVLVVLSSPRDAMPLDVEQEKGIIEGALGDWIDQGLVQLCVLERGVAAEIGQAMRAFRPHVFHFVGHGQHRGEEAYVLLEDSAGRARPVGVRTFREFFLGIADTRLAVFNACQLATTSSTRPLAGLAPRLLQRNLSAVVAMQSPIADRTALIFSREFYRSLALGYPVDGALAEARKGIFLEVGGDAQEWGVPVLFLRAQDGRLFELAEAEEVEPEVAPPPEPTPPPVVTGFVGREAELGYFAQKLATSGLAVVAGMPGVGKTALAAVLAGRAGAPGKTLWHTFHQGEGVEGIIWKLAGFLFWHGEEQEVLWRMLHLARLTGGQPPPTRELLDYLTQMMRGQGYLLCLDDWQFLSGEDTDLLDRFVQRSTSGGTSFVIASQVMPEFVRTADFEPLAGLSAEDTRRLLADRGLALPGDLAAELHARTGGNAQFLTLAIDALQSAGDPARLIDELSETDDIERFLMAEVDEGLTEDEREVMCGVALLLGYPGTRDAVEDILDAGRLKRRLIDLSRRHLLTVHEGERDQEYGQNAVVREFYYDLLGRRERREMHRRAGAYYETEEPDALKAARHYERAGEVKRAAELATADVLAFINQGQARVLCQLLERFAAGQLEPMQWAKVNIARGRVYTVLGMYSAEGGRQPARDSYQEALSVLAALTPPSTGSGQTSPEVRRLTVQACRRMGELLQYKVPQEALDWLNRGLGEISGDQFLEEAAALHLTAGNVQSIMGDYQAALKAVQQGLEMLPEGVSQLRVDALINLGKIYGYQGIFDQFESYERQALQLCRQLHDYLRMSTILNNLGVFKYYAGDWAGAIGDYLEAIDLAEHLGSVTRQARSHMNLGLVYVNQGDDEAAWQHLANSLDLARDGDLGEYEILGQSNLADLYLRQGKPEAATPLLIEAERLALETSTKWPLPRIYYRWAEAHLLSGEAETALHDAERSVSLAQEMGMTQEEGMSRRVLGQALLAGDQPEKAAAAFERSLALLADRDPYEAARTRMQWGLALISGEDAERGRELLEEARATFEKLGARRDLAAVEEALRALPR
jgi:tetratricopeptide (TPR) repeat protein